MTKKEEAIKRLKYIRAEYEEPLELNSREDVRRGIQMYLDAIDIAIESMQNERPKGRWECGVQNGSNGYWCTNCHAGFTGDNAEWIAKEHDFCPKCGAEMER